MALGSFQSPFRDPIVAMYRYCVIITCPERLVLPFIFSVQKNLQLPVQVAMGFLTRHVTGYEAQHHAGHHEYGNDNEGSLHHISVPLIRPSTMLITTAELNIAVSMYTKSI